MHLYILIIDARLLINWNNVNIALDEFDTWHMNYSITHITEDAAKR